MCFFKRLHFPCTISPKIYNQHEKIMSYKSLLLVLFATTLTSTSVFASGSDNHFEGAYVVLSNEWKSASVNIDGEKIKRSEAAPSIGAGYTFALDSHKTIGVKLTVDTKKGEYGVGEIGGHEAAVQEKSHYSLAIEPGYAFNDKFLAFGILAYHTAKAKLEAPGIEKEGESRINGLAYGIGAKYALPHHLFLMAEIQQVRYNSKIIDTISVKPKSNVVALGVGYHF